MTHLRRLSKTDQDSLFLQQEMHKNARRLKKGKEDQLILILTSFALMGKTK